VSRIEELIATIARGFPGFQASVKVLKDRPPIETDPASPAVHIFAAAVHDIVGKPPEPKGVMYYTDASALVPALQAPMIICGPGDVGLAHQPDEYVEIKKLREAAEIFAFAAQRFLC
jgi:succinyl-diaminopimelate desuccinylase